MRKTILASILGTSLLLAGCNENDMVQLQTQYKVVIAPNSLYNCPQVTKWPKVKTLTDLQVARVMVQLAESNKICAASLNAVKQFYADAKVRIEGSNPTKRK
jgi:uncharacterized protein YcfL